VRKKIVQFGYKWTDPPVDVPTIDCRVIQNPFVRGLSDAVLKARVRQHPKFMELVYTGIGLLQAYDTIAVGCAFGRHRSGAVAEEIAKHTGAVVEIL
jgi:RNase adaptor protein for sRNA GlmZ degradation